jgi:hypothetical protein
MEVEDLKRRFEKIERFTLKRKMKPNVPRDWIEDLRRTLKHYGHYGSPSAPSSFGSCQTGRIGEIP